MERSAAAASTTATSWLRRQDAAPFDSPSRSCRRADRRRRRDAARRFGSTRTHRTLLLAAAARAHRLAQACEGARTPALAALAAPLPLTRREREIVTLAAGGLSNRQIADRLVVSVRTVEGHLYRACAKLGVSDPSELAPLLHGD